MVSCASHLMLISAGCRAVPDGEAAPGLEYYAFPTLQQLGDATEAHLRASGFGYRSAFGCQDYFGARISLLSKVGN